MTTLYKYRVFCLTDEVFKTVWDEIEPTVCPQNAGHSIDTVLTTIIDERKPDVVRVKEETIETGGHFACRTLTINCAPNATTEAKISWPHPVSLLSLDYVSTLTHQGDLLDACVARDSTIGAITNFLTPPQNWQSQNYTTGDSVLYTLTNLGIPSSYGKVLTYTCINDTVSNEPPTNPLYWRRGYKIPVQQTVIDYSETGHYIKITDGSNTDDLGAIIYVDTANLNLYMDKYPVNSYSPLTPTYVLLTVYSVKDYEIGPPWGHTIGESKIGGSYIPPDTVLSVLYTNKSNESKYFVGQVEYLY